MSKFRELDFEKNFEIYRDKVSIWEENEIYNIEYELVVYLVDGYTIAVLEDADGKPVYSSPWWKDEVLKYVDLNKPYYTKMRRALQVAFSISKMKTYLEYNIEIELNNEQEEIYEYFACREIAFELSNRIVQKKMYLKSVYEEELFKVWNAEEKDNNFGEVELSDINIKKIERRDLTDEVIQKIDKIELNDGVIKEIKEHELEDIDRNEIEIFEIDKMKKDLRIFLRALSKKKAVLFGMIDAEEQRRNIDKVVSFFYKNSILPEDNILELYSMSLLYILGKVWNKKDNITNENDIFGALESILDKKIILTQYEELFREIGNSSIEKIIYNYTPGNISIDENTTNENKVYAIMVFFVLFLVDKKKSRNVSIAVDSNKMILFVKGVLKSTNKKMKNLIDRVYQSNTIHTCEKNNGLFCKIEEDKTELLFRSFEKVKEKMFDERSDKDKRRNRKVKNSIMRDYCNGMYKAYCEIVGKKITQNVSYSVLKNKFEDLQIEFFGKNFFDIDLKMSKLSKKSVGYFANLLMIMRICMGPYISNDMYDKMEEIIEEKRDRENLVDRFLLINICNDLDILSYIDFVYELYEMSYTVDKKKLVDVIKGYWCKKSYYKQEYADIATIILTKLTSFDSLSISESRKVVETVLGEANKIEKRLIQRKKM